MNAILLTNDAKAILMLCGRFHTGDSPESVMPLSLKEYNRLTDWMLERALRPQALLTEAGLKMLTAAPADLDGLRIGRLLARGPAMAFAIEKWTGAGVWVICRSDAHYPERLKRHLKKQAPPILYGIGDIGLLSRGGLAIVGSRNVDASGEDYTRKAASACAGQAIQVVSGGARGVDQIAMDSALDAGGTVVGVVADSLIKSAVTKRYRDPIREKRLALMSAYRPDARFNVGNAMGRNKQIYALADAALIISAEKGSGGTWAGATEELKRDDPHPVFVRRGADAPEGNRSLMELGAQPFPMPPWETTLSVLLTGKPVARRQPAAVQKTLFGDPAIISPVDGIKEAPAHFLPGRIDSIEPAAVKAPAESHLPAGIFEAALPVILEALEDWAAPNDLADRLGVRKYQLDDWLKQALESGVVQKKTKPVRYRRK